MKPIQLKMTAFGPYAGEEVIDFNNIHENSLFLVTGPTGAGKTTLFDAISYALYGETSGNERTGDALRSDFASQGLLTSVYFEFTLRGKSYWVERIPKQQRLKTRGEGTTVQNSTATFKEIEGTKPTTGVQNVNDAIRDLVGLTAEQFRQIMMIPQGQFQKFLLAGSDERSKILKTLFDTSFFGQIQEVLKNQAMDLKSQIQNEIIRRNEKLKFVKCSEEAEIHALLAEEEIALSELLPALEALIQEDLKKGQDFQEQGKGIQRQKKEVLIQKEKDLNHNQLVKQLEIESTRLESLKEKEEIMADTAKRIEMVKKIEGLLIFEEQFTKVKLKRQEHEEQVQRLTLEQEQHQTEYARLKMSYEEMHSDAYQKKLEVMRQQKDQYKRFHQQIQQFQQQTVKLEKSKAEKESVVKKCDEIANQQLAIEAEMIEQKKEIEAMHQLAIEDQKITTENTQLESYVSMLKGLYKVLQKRIKVDDHLSETTLAIKEATSQLEGLKMQLEAIINEDIHKQAVMLAENLKQGEPCPVCGSLEHPHIAVKSTGKQSDAEREQLEKQVEALKEKGIKDKYRLETLTAELENMKVEIHEYIEAYHQKVPETLRLSEVTLEQVEVLGKELGKRIKAQASEQGRIRQKMENLTLLDKEVQSKQQAFEELLVNLDKLKQEVRFYEDQIAAAQTLMKQIETEVPEALLKHGDFESLLLETETHLNQALLTQENVSRQWQSAQLKAQALTTEKQHLTTALEQLNSDFKELQIQIQKKREETGVTDEQRFKSAKEDASKVKELELILKEYDAQRTITQSRMEALKEQLQHESLIDMTPYQEKERELETAEKEANRLENYHLSAAQDNRKILEDVKQMSSDVKGIEAEYAVIGKLSRVANGQNRKRLSFERYVLASFLEDILNAANVRLMKMTDHRYKLKRYESVSDKRMAGGLELNVHDHYTGMDRHVNTLSGGEGFKASLAMALGLSDVVQSYAGGVRLDTMFIDEGFGTLDAESLDQAIECLIEIQKTGRLVGIISHVGELKERIKTQLEIIPSNTGSRTNNFA